MVYKLKAKKMAGTVSLRTLPIFISGQNVYKTQTAQEALRRLLSTYIFTQQLIRKISEIISCLSLLCGMAKKSGPSLKRSANYYFQPCLQKHTHKAPIIAAPN